MGCVFISGQIMPTAIEASVTRAELGIVKRLKLFWVCGAVIQVKRCATLALKVWVDALEHGGATIGFGDVGVGWVKVTVVADCGLHLLGVKNSQI